MEEINRTSSHSVRDYTKILHWLSDDELIRQAVNDVWLADHIQMSEIDFAARYQACRSELQIRKLKITLDKPPTV